VRNRRGPWRQGASRTRAGSSLRGAAPPARGCAGSSRRAATGHRAAVCGRVSAAGARFELSRVAEQGAHRARAGPSPGSTRVRRAMPRGRCGPGPGAPAPDRIPRSRSVRTAPGGRQRAARREAQLPGFVARQRSTRSPGPRSDSSSPVVRRQAPPRRCAPSVNPSKEIVPVAARANRREDGPGDGLHHRAPTRPFASLGLHLLADRHASPGDQPPQYSSPP